MHRTHNETPDIQGRVLGMPYDFRVPTLPKIAKRLYQPGGPLLVPKVFGMGWSLNYAHPKTPWLLAMIVTSLALVLLTA